MVVVVIWRRMWREGEDSRGKVPFGGVESTANLEREAAPCPARVSRPGTPYNHGTSHRFLDETFDLGKPSRRLRDGP